MYVFFLKAATGVRGLWSTLVWHGSIKGCLPHGPKLVSPQENLTRENTFNENLFSLCTRKRKWGGMWNWKTETLALPHHQLAGKRTIVFKYLLEKSRILGSLKKCPGVLEGFQGIAKHKWVSQSPASPWTPRAFLPLFLLLLKLEMNSCILTHDKDQEEGWIGDSHGLALAHGLYFAHFHLKGWAVSYRWRQYFRCSACKLFRDC